MNITLGCDPEIFVATKEGNPRSAHGLIPGTKDKPHPVNFGAVQVDGMALEFNIDAVKTEDDWVRNINEVMAQMKAMIPDDLEFKIVPSVRFNGAHFRAQPDEAKELGCTPDYNAYTMSENPKPDNKTTMRTAAGHVHIGFLPNGELTDPNTEEHMLRCSVLVKQLDFVLGLASLLWDKDTKRRSMYGKAGAFRPKPYGVEYRVLSNAWLLSENRMRLVHKLTNLAVEKLIDGSRFNEIVGDLYLQGYINNSNVYDAEYWLKDQLGSAIVSEIRKAA